VVPSHLNRRILLGTDSLVLPVALQRDSGRRDLGIGLTLPHMACELGAQPHPSALDRGTMHMEAEPNLGLHRAAKAAIPHWFR
jgi:hypothetical protein